MDWVDSKTISLDEKMVFQCIFLFSYFYFTDLPLFSGKIYFTQIFTVNCSIWPFGCQNLGLSVNHQKRRNRSITSCHGGSCLDNLAVWYSPGMRETKGRFLHRIFCSLRSSVVFGDQLWNSWTYSLLRQKCEDTLSQSEVNVRVDSCLDSLALWFLFGMPKNETDFPVEA